MKEYLRRFTKLNWKIIVLFAIAIFYAGLFVISIRDSESPIHYGGDYLAFWSAGKIADEQGFSEIYDLETLRKVQSLELKLKGFIGESDTSSFITLPAPYLSFFILPFGLLSRINVESSYWVWVVLNLFIVIGYLIFFIRKTRLQENGLSLNFYLLTLVLASFPLFDNLINGQLNVFLMVCTGEFVRNALRKKPVLSGVWLGGLLLKPQLLILIIPILLIRRQWKAFFGFAISSGLITLSSIALSGIEGTLALIRLWTGWGEGNAITAPTAMINWRMIGTLINDLTNLPVGWIFAGLGIAVTLMLIYFIEKNTSQDNPRWVLGILGIFATTLVITWHSHHHMALVLIPLLLYVTVNNLFPENILFLWVVLPPLAWVIALITGQAGFAVDQMVVVAITGFFACHFVIVSVFKYLKNTDSGDNRGT